MMDQDGGRRGARVLWGLIVLALVYTGLIYHLDSLTGSKMLDGVLDVVLGLYICSHPAANAVDLLFFERAGLRRISSERDGLGWLALNLLVLLVGWFVIVTGTTRLVA